MDSKLKSKIESKIDQIDVAIFSNYNSFERINNSALFCGIPGILMLYAHLYQITGNIAFKNKALKIFDYLLQMIEAESTVTTTFCNGLAGLGWLFIFLKNNNEAVDICSLLELDDFLDELDEALEQEVDKMLVAKNYDLLHGVLGIGLYFIKRQKHEIVERICEDLYHNCELRDGEIKWKRFDKYRANEYIYDLGLAHGNSGILYFLGKCYTNNIALKKCKTLIDGIFKFYLNNRQDLKIVESNFPASIIVNGYSSGHNPPLKSRLAWCYGDLGILHTLLLVSGWIGDQESRSLFEVLLEEVAMRRSASVTRLEDSHFCHGKAGVGYIFFSIYHMTQNPVFEEAAEFWLNQVLDDGNNENGFAGYLFKMGDNLGWDDMMDILNGIGGVGLFLASYMSERKNFDLDECLFLS